MRIWIDADGCPRPVKEIVFRTSQRLKLPVCLVADRQVGRPSNPLVTTVRVTKDMDAADHYIADHLEPEDLVITTDLPLAAEVVAKGATGLNPRGELYTEENVRERLSMRDFLTGLRDAGVTTGGPAPYGPKDRQRFAEALDRLLTARLG
ncbi:MAG: YaiI/YqxD family protein [Desulfarculaceae bacterium]|nr:YaiI/YqxD family protein [Desulfarculaceae bacterium]MCF8072507.1 YaiI/YqxD family protein [Desulfarculaceae bacterium]MCF8103648.1 YaiI/YqxD family protein [Desulfarculaceae bacterium]MCF8117048.1 YaiI/YqxD family protein [Desulfarculaceae bacterium]